MTFPKHYFGAFTVRSGNSNKLNRYHGGGGGIQVVLIQVGSFGVYGISKLRCFKNGKLKEETEVKVTFLLTWVHEWWNSDLALGYKLLEATFETPL